MPAAALCSLAALTWVYLLAGHGGYWRTDQRLPASGPAPRAWPDVVAVVPARNESSVLPFTLPTLLGQDYPGDFSVVLVDDDSSDGTGEVARGLGDAAPGRLRVVAGAHPGRLGGQGLGHGAGPAGRR